MNRIHPVNIEHNIIKMPKKRLVIKVRRNCPTKLGALVKKMYEKSCCINSCETSTISEPVDNCSDNYPDNFSDDYSDDCSVNPVILQCHKQKPVYIKQPKQNKLYAVSNDCDGNKQKIGFVSGIYNEYNIEKQTINGNGQYVIDINNVSIKKRASKICNNL